MWRFNLLTPISEISATEMITGMLYNPVTLKHPLWIFKCLNLFLGLIVNYWCSCNQELCVGNRPIAQSILSLGERSPLTLGNDVQGGPGNPQETSREFSRSLYLVGDHCVSWAFCEGQDQFTICVEILDVSACFTGASEGTMGWEVV